MNYTFASISIAGFLIAGAVAVFVLARNPRNLLNQLFFVYASAVAFFCLFDFMTLITEYPARAEAYNHLSIALWLLFIAVLLHFCLIFAGVGRALVNRLILPANYAATLGMIYLSCSTDWFYQPPVKTAWGMVALLGDRFSFFAAYSMTVVLAQILLLALARSRAKNSREKTQIAIIMLGLAAGFCIGTISDVILPLFGFRFPTVVPGATILYVLFFGYAMIRYGLLVATPARLAQDIINTMPDFLIFTDPQERVILVNQNYLRSFGFSSEEVIGRKFTDLHEHNHIAEHEEILSSIDRNGFVKGKELWLLKKSGERVPVIMSASLVRGQFGDEIGRLHIFHDISEERRLLSEQKQSIEELSKTKERMLSVLEDTTASRDEAKAKAVELAKAVEDLKVVDKMKTEFLSVISHELRTPLTPIIGYISIFLGEQFGKLEPHYKDAAEIIKAEGKHLLELIDNILDVSRLERGRVLELRKEPVSIQNLVKELLPVLRPQYETREIKIEVDISEDFYSIVGDPSKIHRLFTNLLGNAIKFSPKGGKIRIVGIKRPDGVEIQVIDNGIGIAKENQGKIFDRFYQVDSSYTRAVGGVGLGLAIAKEIVEAHGGKIWVESEGLGRGTKIIFELPLGQ